MATQGNVYNFSVLLKSLAQSDPSGTRVQVFAATPDDARAIIDEIYGDDELSVQGPTVNSTGVYASGSFSSKAASVKPNPIPNADEKVHEEKHHDEKHQDEKHHTTTSKHK